MMIYDKIRGTYLKATAEEKVRQRIIAWIEGNGVPATLIGREVKMKVSGRTLRADIVVFSKEMKPLLVVECKAPEVNITDKVLFQVFEYNRELSCKYVMVTNGKDSYCFIKAESGFSQIDDPSVIWKEI